MLLLTIFSLCRPEVFAQAATGNFTGIVFDRNKEPVHQAVVSLRKPGLSFTTDTAGRFVIAGIYPGIYQVTVEADGFHTDSLTIAIYSGRETIKELFLNRATSLLEDVMITAEKRTTTLQKTPLAISVLDAKKIEDYRLWSLKDLSAVVPNLFIPQGGSDLPYYSIRGIYSNSLNQSVAIYVDGIMQYDAESTLRNLYDVERMEIMRGPQGTLYGRNAMAGVINIITCKPRSNTSGYADLSIGNFGSHRYSAGLRGPLVKGKLSYGLAAAFNKSGGYYTNVFNGEQFDRNRSIDGSFTLRYQPSDKWTLSMNLKAQQTVNHGAFPYVSNDSIAMAEGYVTNQDASGMQRRHLYSAAISAQHYGRWFDVNSVTGFQYADKFIYEGLWDGDWSPYNLFRIGYAGSPKDNSTGTLTQEIRLSSKETPSGKVSWTAGGFYMLHPEKETSLLVAGNDAALTGIDPLAPYTLSTSSRLNNHGYAFFGQITYSPLYRLHITAGARYDREHKTMRTGTVMIKDGLEDMQLVPRTKISGNYRALSPRLNVAFELSERVLLYATCQYF